MKKAYAVFNNPHFHYLHKAWVESVGAEFIESLVFPSRFFFAKTILKAFKNRNKYDCVIIVGGSGLQLSVFTKLFNPKIKLIYLNIDPLFYEIESKSLLKRTYLKFLASRIDAVISNSELVDYFARKHINCKTTVVPPFFKDSSITAKGLEKDRLNNIAFLGRLSREKNVDLIITAFNELREQNKKLHLYIIGDGPFREKLENMAGEGVMFMGFIEKPFEILSKCGILLQPSRFESFGLSVFEGILAGNIPITTNKMGVSQFLPEELVIDNLSKEEVIKKITYIQSRGINNLKKLSKSLQRRVKDFTKERSMKEFKKAFYNFCK